MTTSKNRIIQFKNTSVERAFEKEAELIKKVQTGDLNQCLLLWRTTTPTLVLPASQKWKATPELTAQLDLHNWHIVSRRTGGAPVPQVQGVINLTHMYVWDADRHYAIQEGYSRFCGTLEHFFNALGLTTENHATPHSYCDGDYNMNINGQKIVGTAQRVITGKERKVILAQACILVDVSLEQLVHPVNLFNQFNQMNDRIKADAHTCIADQLETVPAIDTLYRGLIQAFVQN
ncbi:lipoate--protein ligase family protein [Marinomonas mediterranea]|jgi:Lipoate-protein ligase A|uniref:BPL/LPL catalytic domain-containing protein n=1 Tax=Marinomonas mediterranea (strain ATCC 700492 / JCM 21426 / NBRC 103028 / MMB-1) TaxID=717774 RepID=F2K4Z6_MARM1|nr:lipoate--protein ligase A [Marinomonas mediterranea]ADZ92639.1 hypothetical protein Marme_3423 [Marinomonas mediterranea MMB-1]WCN18675.1 lipoate--protein ligase [Marinomonas mediterranea MMB-1]